MPLDFAQFKEKVGKLCNIDLSSYKSVQMDRRIMSLMTAWGLSDFDAYYETLQKNPVRYREFVKKLTINVSEFFRNPERFEELKQHIIPELLKHFYQIKIWSAGCSNGSEPYSLAIIFKELNAVKRVSIIATDIDQAILAKAKAAVYSSNEIRNLSPELIAKYFHEDGGSYHLKPEIQAMVDFRQHNLLQDPFPQPVELILCRNVVIYFTEEAKADLYGKFYRSLSPGGYLMVGGTEPLLYYRNYGFDNPLSFFYRKPPETAERGLGH
jgi:chemotaxis protein methyltransferase CheR